MSSSAFGRIGNVTGAILAGGSSRRMGLDKARLAVAGVANATRLGRVLAGCFEEVLLVGGDPPDDAPGRRIADVPGPGCALRGLVSAFEASAEARVFVLATDLPRVTPALVLALVAWPEAEAVVPVPAEGVQPLCAVYRREPALLRAREGLAAGRLKLSDWLATLDTQRVDAAALARVDPGGHALQNLNTPYDALRAEQLFDSD